MKNGAGSEKIKERKKNEELPFAEVKEKPVKSSKQEQQPNARQSNKREVEKIKRRDAEKIKAVHKRKNALEAYGYLEVSEPEKIKVESAEEALTDFRKRKREELREKFPEDEYAFHNVKHAEFVAENAVDFLDTVQEIDPALVDTEDLVVEEVLGLCHDDPQDFAYTEGESITRARQRGFDAEMLDPSTWNTEPNPTDEEKPFAEQVGNEQTAAYKAINELRRYRDEDGNLIFPPEKYSNDELMHIIGGTYPEPAFYEVPDEYCPDNLKGETVFTMEQPDALRPEASIREVGMAFADLKAPQGKYPPETGIALAGSKNEYQELFKSHTDLLKEQEIENIPVEKRAAIAESMLDWLKSQQGFFLGQKVSMEKILAANNAINQSEKSNKIKSALREKYKHFEANAQHAYDYYKEAESAFGIAEYEEELKKAKNTGETKAETEQAIEAVKSTRREKLKEMSAEDFRNLCKKLGYEI